MRLCIMLILLIISIKTFVPKRKIRSFQYFKRYFQLLTDVNFCSHISDFRYILAYIIYIHLLILFSAIAHLYRCKNNFQCNINKLYNIRTWVVFDIPKSVLSLFIGLVFEILHFVSLFIFWGRAALLFYFIFYPINFCLPSFIKFIVIDLFQCMTWHLYHEKIWQYVFIVKSLH